MYFEFGIKIIAKFMVAVIKNAPLSKLVDSLFQLVLNTFFR